MLFIICSIAPIGDVAATEAYGEEVHRLLMICGRKQDDDEDDESDLLAVAVNNLAYICRDLGTERFAPFFQSCIEVISNLLSAIPSSHDDGDDLSPLKRIDCVSDAIEVLASAHGTTFLPALLALLPSVTTLASSTSGESALNLKPLFISSCSFPASAQRPSPPPPSALSHQPCPPSAPVRAPSHCTNPLLRS